MILNANRPTFDQPCAFAALDGSIKAVVEVLASEVANGHSVGVSIHIEDFLTKFAQGSFLQRKTRNNKTIKAAAHNGIAANHPNVEYSVMPA